MRPARPQSYLVVHSDGAEHRAVHDPVHRVDDQAGDPERGIVDRLRHVVGDVVAEALRVQDPGRRDALPSQNRRHNAGSLLVE